MSRGRHTVWSMRRNEIIQSNNSDPISSGYHGCHEKHKKEEFLVFESTLKSFRWRQSDTPNSSHTHKRQAHKSCFVCFQLGNSEIIINLTILHTDGDIDILALRSRSRFIVVEMKAQLL